MVLLGDEAQVQLILINLEIVLILMENRCIVYTECSIGSKIILDAPNETLR
jgi:hypothetical protein